MTSFTQVFGGGTVSPSEHSYALYTVGGTLSLRWPIEASSAPVAARIMDVDPGPNFVMLMPDARVASVGETVTISNIGASSFEVRNNNNAAILTLPPGTTYMLYLRDNSTKAGLWRALRFGSGVTNAVASALAGPGMTAIGSLLSPTFVTSEKTASFTATDEMRGETIVWTAGTGTVSLPSPAVLSDGWYCIIKNIGTGSLNVNPVGTFTIDGYTSMVFSPEDSAIIITDGEAYYTIGKGGSVDFVFSFQAVDISGGGDRILSPAEYRKTSLRLDGDPTVVRDIIFPNIVNEYWIDNNTSEDALLKTASQSTPERLRAGQRSLFYCDGTTIIRAVTVSPFDFGAGATGRALIPTGTPEAARNVVDVYSRGESVALILALS